MNIIYKIISNFINNKSLYIGEKVTMSDHMIQSAMIAERKKSSKSLICACLLHDYGHFILEDPDELVRKKLDGKHEEIGYEYLSKFFNEDVVGPIKYHVKAKRYLSRERKYYSLLSKDLKHSLTGIAKSGLEQYDHCYNWPYDFFSIVELIKVDSKVDFSSRE